jgi:hypothetical protein
MSTDSASLQTPPDAALIRHLLAGAGWRLSRVIPTGSPAQIVEAEPA